MTNRSDTFCTIHRVWYMKTCPKCGSLADSMLESAIAAVSTALAQTGDKRFVKAQRFLISLRTPTQVRRMEQMQRISEHGHHG